MPSLSLSDIPGKSLIGDGGRRARAIAAGAAVAAIAVGGYAVRRVLRRGDEGEGEVAASADPIAQTPIAPPQAEAPPASEKESQAEEPEPAAAEPGNRSGDAEPHHALNNPVTDEPDPTEWPDPYEKRPDPRDPADPDGAPFGEEPHPPTGAGSTSEPHPGEDPEAGDRAKPPEQDR